MKNLKFYATLGLVSISVSLSAQNKITLHPDKAEQTISKDIYGHFAEHLGRCIYGGIYVGTDSKIPNTNGYRNDVVEALKELKIPVLRWPGGCFADTYHWKDGIGPKENRPSIINTNWGGVTEDNSFGTHEFLDFCELLGCDAYVNLNVGSGEVREAAEWVEYITSSNESPMTQLRKQNGREDPWNVKYFGIGNENWGCGGNMEPEYYADVYRRYATFCGGAPYRIACGASADDPNWTEVLMKKTEKQHSITQGLSLHKYTLPIMTWVGSKGSATDFKEDMWFSTVKEAWAMDSLLKIHIAIMDKYDPNNEVGIIFDEWGCWYDVEPGTNPGFLYQQNTMRDAIVAGMGLNIFNNYSYRIQMANIAQMVNVLQAVILTKDEQMVLTPTYYVFKMYADHQNAKLIPLDVVSEKYTYNGVSTDAICASASTKDGVVTITLCNINPNDGATVEINVGDIESKTIKGEIVTAQKMNDFNDFGQPEKITLKPFDVKKPVKGQLSVNMPAMSVVKVQLSK